MNERSVVGPETLGPVWLACALMCITLTLSASAIEVVLTRADGQEVSGELKSADARTGVGVADKVVKLGDIAEIRFKGVDKVGVTDLPAIRLRNDDLLRAKIVSGDDEALKVKSELLGDLVLKYTVLLGIVFPVKSPPPENVVEAFFAGRNPDKDRVLTPHGDTVAGFMEKFTDKALGFEAGGQKRTMPFDQLPAIRFAALEEFKPLKAVLAVVRLADGSRLSGIPAGLAGDKLQLNCGGSLIFLIPTNKIRSIGVKGGRLVYLSELKPKAVEQKPLVGGAPLVLPWRADRAVTGQTMKIGRRPYDRGLGVHSYCRLAYDLGGRYETLLVDVGLDASAEPAAICSWAVLADGAKLAEGEAKAGAPARKLKLTLKGAKTLELICDYGPDRDDVGDRLDWADARLVK